MIKKYLGFAILSLVLSGIASSVFATSTATSCPSGTPQQDSQCNSYGGWKCVGGSNNGKCLIVSG